MNKIKEFKNISIPMEFSIDESFQDERFIKARARIMHSGVNPNNSDFDVESMQAAEYSIANIPILANVVFDEDGIPQFGAHDTIIEEDKVNEGEYREVYQEVPIGVIPETNNYEIKEYNGKDYVYTDVYYWKNYSNYAEDILKRDKDIKISMEINVNKFSYDHRTKIHKIHEYEYKGITLLGNNYQTGMENALSTTEIRDDFVSSNNSNKLFVMMSELKNSLEKHSQLNEFNKKQENNKNEGGNKLDEKLELLKTFNLTVENLDFNIDELTIDDLKIKVEEFINKKTEDLKEDLKFVEGIKTKFAFYSQKRDAIRNSLEDSKVYDGSGNVVEYTSYYLDDFNDEYAHVERDHYTPDNYTSDYGRFSYSFDNSTLSAKITSEFEPMIKTWLTVPEYNSLQKEQTDLKSKLESLLAEYELYKSEYTTKDSDVKEFEALKEYKVQKELEEFNEAKESLFSQFEDLKDIKEFETLKSNTEFTLDDIEKELFCMRGKKLTTNFTAVKKKVKEEPKTQFTKIPMMESEVTDMNKENFDDVYNKYNK